MKKEFLNNLHNELLLLKKEERNRYISYYEELLSDKIESGLSEEEAIKELGSVLKIKDEIYQTYKDKDVSMTSLANKNLRKKNSLTSICLSSIFITTIAYIISFLIYRSRGVAHIPFSFPFGVLVLVISILIDFMLKLRLRMKENNYFKDIKKSILHIFFRNIVLIVFLYSFLYFLSSMYSRILIIGFVVIKIMLEFIYEIVDNRLR